MRRTLRLSCATATAATTVDCRAAEAQRIGGEVALALPKSSCHTLLLDMTDDERTL